MNKAISYLREVRLEMSKVVWPSRSDVIKLTTTVILISAIVAAYLTVLDLAFVKLLERIIGI